MPGLALSGSLEGPQARGPIIPSNDLAILQVNVTLSSGLPVPAHVVFLENLNKMMGILANQTDSNGRTNITVSSLNWGPTKVYCDATSTYGQLGMREVFIGPNDIVYLHLVLTPIPPSVNLITGKVYNWSSKLPVPSNPINVKGTDTLGRTFTINTMSDETGTYSVYVPNSTSPYILTPANTYVNLVGDSTYLFLEPGSDRYVLDLPLRSTWFKRVQLEMMLTDLNSGSPIRTGVIRLGGYVSEFQHTTINFGTIGTPDGTGKVVTAAPLGEHEVTWTDANNALNLTMNCRQPLVMNDTPTEAEMKVPIPPAFRHIRLWTKSGGTVLPGITVQSTLSYSVGLDSMDISIGGLTNSSGCFDFGTLPDTDTTLTLTRTGFRIMKYTIPAGPDSSPLELTIDLGEKKEGNLSVFVRDEMTGALVPYCTVRVSDADSRSTSRDCDLEGRANFTYTPQTVKTITATANIGSASISNVEVKEGEVTEVTLYLKRNSMPLPKYYGYFYVKDRSGLPISDVQVSIYPMVAGYTIRSAPSNDGKVRFYGPLSDYQIAPSSGSSYFGSFRSVWGYPAITFTHSYGGQRQNSIIAYPSEPMVPLIGTVRDLLTDKPLDHATLMTSSLTYSNYGYYTTFSQMVRSMDNGRYRIWGREYIIVQVSRTGYFQYFIELNESILEQGSLDIYLTPIPASTIWVNGTLVDENDQTIAGYIYPDDIENNGALPYVKVNDTGHFGLHLYPGKFSIYFSNGNSSISDTLTLEVGTSDISGLVLKLVAHNNINGKVTDALGTPLQGVNVTIECVDGYRAGTSLYDLTDSQGRYYFSAYKGSYRTTIDWSVSFDKYESDVFLFPATSNLVHDIVLSARSHTDIQGRVMGKGGPSDPAIPGAPVMLHDRSGTIIAETLTELNGNFTFEKAPYGTEYWLEAAPPVGMAYEDWNTSGYTSAVSFPFDLATLTFSTYIVLPYVDLKDLVFLEVENVYPTGTGVQTDKGVQVRFNIPVNRSSLEGSFSIAPEVGNVSFHWFEDGTEVTIGHDPFAYDTEYTIILGEGLRAETGAPLREGTMNWTFRTIAQERWELTDADAIVGTDRSVNITASGLSGISVHVVIDLLGSFPMGEVGPGMYRRTIPSSMLEWNTSYTYHFSDVANGFDKAPSLSGTFRTPIEPVLWRLDSASVRLDEGGDWIIEANGLPGMDVWFVVDGVGSFKLEEIAPGNYRADIPDGRFKQGKEYDYWFSDQEDGEDLAPALSGSHEAKSETFELKDGLPLFCCLVIVLVTILALIALVLFLVNSRKGTDEDEEWGEE